MKANKLEKILELHAKWLNGEEGGEIANLKRADLRGENLRNANLRNANLKRADLRRANLAGADLRWVNLGGADLRWADLAGANLIEANLSGADLRWANLTGVTLSEANLRGADLDYSCLPLLCGSLSANFDDRQLKQIAYHLVKAGLQSENASEEAKTELRKLIPFANEFHKVGLCGFIKEMRAKEE